MTTSIFLDIPRRSSRCSLGNEVLHHGEEYYSVLLQDPQTDKIKRQEFCLSCWKENRPKEATSHWKAKIPDEKPRADSPKDHQLFLQLQELSQSADPEAKANALALSLYLARKKKLVLRKEIEHAGEETYLFEVIDSGEILRIKKVPFPQLQQALTCLVNK